MRIILELAKNPAVLMLVFILVLVLLLGAYQKIKLRKSVERNPRGQFGNKPIKNSELFR